MSHSELRSTDYGRSLPCSICNVDGVGFGGLCGPWFFAFRSRSITLHVQQISRYVRARVTEAVVLYRLLALSLQNPGAASIISANETPWLTGMFDKWLSFSNSSSKSEMLLPLLQRHKQSVCRLRPARQSVATCRGRIARTDPDRPQQHVIGNPLRPP